MITRTSTRPGRTSSRAAAIGELIELRIDRVFGNAVNERDFDDDDGDGDAHIESLTQSIEQHGLIQPIVVRPVGSAKYEVVCGERRLRAAKAAGKRKILAIVRNLSLAEALIAMVQENVEREPWNAIQVATIANKLRRPENRGGAGLTRDDIARLFKMDHGSSISNLEKLLDLPPQWKRRVARCEITQSAGRELAKYVGDSGIMQQVEMSYQQNPDQWDTALRFESSLKRIVERQDAGTARAKRDAFERDHKFREWHTTPGERGHRSPAEIRDRWNGMTQAERLGICQGARANVTIETVNAALKKAKAEHAAERQKKPKNNMGYHGNDPR